MDFRKSSDDFIAKNSRLKIVENPASVMFHVFSWTGSELYLTELILDLILKRDFKIAQGEEEQRVEEFVQSYIIKWWEQQEAADHLRPIQNRLLNHPQKDKALLKLKALLAQETVLTDDSKAVQALLASNIAVDKGGTLKIHNPIYKAVFNQSWINQELAYTTVSQPIRDQTATAGKLSSLGKAISSFNWRVLFPMIVGFLILDVMIFVWHQKPRKSINTSLETQTSAENRYLGISDGTSTNKPWQKISLGERSLMPDEDFQSENSRFRTAKIKGIQDITQGRYEEAAIHFKQALSYHRNAPETLIYLNNARSELVSPHKSYTIAVAVPIVSDLIASQAMLQGVGQAQYEINQRGGIDGIPIKVAIVDDSGSPETVARVAETLGRKPEILGVVGHYYSDLTLNAADAYQAAKLPIVALGSAVEISQLKNDYVFRVTPSDAVTGRTLARYTIDTLNKKKVAVFFNSKNAHSQSLTEEFVSSVLAEGGEVVAELDWSQHHFDSQKAIDLAVAKKAQTLLLVPSEIHELKTYATSIAQLNAKLEAPLQLIGGDVLDSNATLNSNFKGAIIGTAWHINTVDSRSNFILQSQQLWDLEINWVTVMAHDAMHAFIGALLQNPNQPTRNDLQQTLSSSKEPFLVPGVSSDIHFNSVGDRAAPIQLVTIEAVAGNDDASTGKYHFRHISSEQSVVEKD